MNRRLALLASAGVLVAASAAVATAAPSPTGVSHRNVHVCSAAQAGYAACDAIRHDTVDKNGKPVAPAATGTPAGYGPADLQKAYGLTGAGSPTIAIVDAYHLPSAESDLATYRSQFGLPPCTSATGCFRQVGQTGQGVPATDAGWGQEIALDLDMVSAACPNCKILLVEATSASFANLHTAVGYAASQPGVVAISNSYGGSELSPSAYPNYDQSAKGIAVTVSTGDSGYGVQSPASFPFVTAVGGTSLSRSTTSARGFTETAWSGAGSGCSRYVAQQPWQNGVVSYCNNRALADVSAVADPNTGVAVFDSTPYNGSSGWMVFGGTSASAPLIAGVYALDGDGGTSKETYTSRAGNFNDVTSGSNGRCNRTPSLCKAASGWDGPTGLGTPAGNGAF